MNNTKKYGIAKVLAVVCGIIGIIFIIMGFFGGQLLASNIKTLESSILKIAMSNNKALIIIGGIAIVFSLTLGNMALFSGWKLDSFYPYLLITPCFVFLLMFVIYPIFRLIYLSLFQGNLMLPTKTFIGLKNYVSIFFIKKDFLVALRNTGVYTLSVVVLLITFSLLFSLWMFKDRRINNFAQTALFTPHLIASICSGFIWAWIMNKNDYGLLNIILGVFGVNPIRWLESTKTAMGSIIAVTVWKNIGYYTLIILAALKSIPIEIYEAASLDNAKPFRTFFKITLPMLSPQLFFLLITITIGSFKVFDTINIMTEGGPGTSTEVVVRYIYDYAFKRTNNLGIGTAAAVVLMIVLMIMTFIYFRGLENKVHYQ